MSIVGHTLGGMVNLKDKICKNELEEFFEEIYL